MRYRHLSPVERYQIEAGLALDMNPRWIADRIGRHVSTIYREFQRSPKHMRTHGYSGSVAHQYYNWNRKKSRRKHVITGKAKEYINNRLSLQWSPEQIAGRARKDGVVAAGTETIYRYVYRDRKQGGTLWKNLRRCRARRKKRFPRPQWPSKDQRLPASSRPIAIENRIRRGDFERDDLPPENSSTCALRCSMSRRGIYEEAYGRNDRKNATAFGGRRKRPRGLSRSRHIRTDTV